MPERGRFGLRDTPALDDVVVAVAVAMASVDGSSEGNVWLNDDSASAVRVIAFVVVVVEPLGVVVFF